ncbi:MAG: hypothetical protein O3B47_04070, partial [bacterium]|nr:hypothetical protein [bacterium]
MDLKFDFSIHTSVREMYVNALTVSIPRYNDIKANKEALIKGVRVFDIPGSDIDAIRRVE